MSASSGHSCHHLVRRDSIYTELQLPDNGRFWQCVADISSVLGAAIMSEAGEDEGLGSASAASKIFQQNVIMDPKIWSNLPQIALELIFARLPLQSLIRLRLLSKQWHAALSSPAFQHAFSDGRPKGFAVVECERVWAYDARATRWHGLPLHYLPFSYLVAADGGLLCFVKFTKPEKRLRVVVCNPLTCTWRELPPLVGVQTIPKAFHMKVDLQSRQYTIKFLGLPNSNEPEYFHVYSSETNSWDRLVWIRQPDVIGRYILVNVYHGSVHTYDVRPGGSSSILFPPDFEHDSVAQVEGSFLFQAEEGRLFLLKTHANKSKWVWECDEKSEQKWEEFSRIPKADNLENYVFCVFLCGDVVLLLGKRRELFYNASHGMELEDKGFDHTECVQDRVDDNLMLMLDMSTKTWTDVTDNNVEPGCLSRFVVELRLDAVP